MSVAWSGGLALIACLLPTLACSQIEPGAGFDKSPVPSATESVEVPVTTGMKRGDALAKAWKDHPQILEAQLALDATAYDISSSRTGYYPFASVASAQGENDNSTVVQLIQPIWSGGLTGAQVDSARAQRRIALAQLNKARLELGLCTAQAYLSAAAALEDLQQWERYSAALRSLQGTIERRVAEGISPESDSQVVSTRISQARAGAESVRATLAASLAVLRDLIDEAPAGAQWPGPEHRLTQGEVDNAGIACIDAHPDRQLALAQVELQNATTETSKAALWPSVALQYRTQLEGRIIDPNDDDAVLLLVQYQTDNGLRGYRSFQADRVGLDSLKAQLETTSREVQLQIATARSQRASSIVQIDTQSEAFVASTAPVDSFLRQFQAGRKSWLNAQREANESNLQLIAARRSFWLAESSIALHRFYWRRLSAQAPSVDVLVDESGP